MSCHVNWWKKGEENGYCQNAPDVGWLLMRQHVYLWDSWQENVTAWFSAGKRNKPINR
jgi:hypothetical protein